MDYTPKPFDDKGIPLPEELECLKEDLARNVHEVWASGRMAAGWKYGPVRDEDKKEHPCLIPNKAISIKALDQGGVRVTGVPQSSESTGGNGRTHSPVP